MENSEINQLIEKLQTALEKEGYLVTFTIMSQEDFDYLKKEHLKEAYCKGRQN